MNKNAVFTAKRRKDVLPLPTKMDLKSFSYGSMMFDASAYATFLIIRLYKMMSLFTVTTVTATGTTLRG